MSNVPPRMPTPVMNYQTPASLAPSLGAVYREGKLLVAPKVVRLPEGCVKCGGPEHRQFVKKYYWHHPAIAVVVLLNVLIYLIVALIVRKRADVTFGLCAQHNGQRNARMAIAGVGLVASIATPAAFFMLVSRRTAEDFAPVAVLFGFIAAIVSLVVLLRANAVLRPKLINDYQVKLAGAGEPYLQDVQRGEAAVLTAMPVA